MEKEMKIEYVDIKDLKPYENNPRINDGAVDAVAASINRFGWKQPLVIDKDCKIVAGHTRYKAAQKLGIKDMPCVRADDLTEEEIKAYRLADNKTAELAEWDFNILDIELSDITDIDMSAFGFDMDDNEWNDNYAVENGSLVNDFLVPPFSILDSTQGYWLDRKRSWTILMGGNTGGEGRDAGLIGGGGLYDLAKRTGSKLTGTSVFDPVLAEVCLKWFCPAGGSVYDPFAGGITRGGVAEKLGFDYTGIELSKRQINQNIKIAKMMGVKPTYICDTSINADNYIENQTIDFVFSCPPYFDLEKYSDDPNDLSNMTYEEFLKTYRSIIETAVRKLKQDRFAVIVIGEVRDKKGFYRDLVSETKRFFVEAGVFFYNDMIYKESIATARFRIRKQFNSFRKVVKTHQNVLVFYKGNPKNIKNNYGEIEIPDLDIYDDKQV